MEEQASRAQSDDEVCVLAHRVAVIHLRQVQGRLPRIILRICVRARIYQRLDRIHAAVATRVMQWRITYMIRQRKTL